MEPPSIFDDYSNNINFAHFQSGLEAKANEDLQRLQTPEIQQFIQTTNNPLNIELQAQLKELIYKEKELRLKLSCLVIDKCTEIFKDPQNQKESLILWNSYSSQKSLFFHNEIMSSLEEIEALKIQYQRENDIMKTEIRSASNQQKRFVASSFPEFSDSPKKTVLDNPNNKFQISKQETHESQPPVPLIPKKTVITSNSLSPPLTNDQVSKITLKQPPKENSGTEQSDSPQPKKIVCVKYSKEEDELLIQLHSKMGPKWASMKDSFPTRNPKSLSKRFSYLKAHSMIPQGNPK